MDRNDILQLSDREIDVLIATEIFGWIWWHSDRKQLNRVYPSDSLGWLSNPLYGDWKIGKVDEYPVDYDLSCPPSFTSDIKEAWRIWQAMKISGHFFDFCENLVQITGNMDGLPDILYSITPGIISLTALLSVMKLEKVNEPN